jgi:hypothetical protein
VAPNGENGGTLGTLTKTLGLLAGLATLVYLTGGLVLALRLAFEDLPWEAVISQLPREFLISVGVTTVVMPILGSASVYTGWRLHKGTDSPLPDARLPTDVCMRTHIAWHTLWVSLLVVAPGVLFELFKDGLRFRLALWGMAAWLITYFWIYGMLWLRAGFARQHRDPGPPARTKPSWYGARAIAVMSALYAAFLLPGAIVLGATLRLTDSRVCAVGGGKVDGVLVGETEQRIYVGEERRGGREDRHIVAIPFDHVAEVIVGNDAHETRCDPSVPAGSTDSAGTS